MPNPIEARESGSPVPAQRAARLPYETEPLQILVDPADPNIDLATQLGLGENTFFSSRLKPGRVIPSYLGISHHVLDYRMDQMAQEPERLAEQPIPPSLLQRVGETLRRVAPPALVPATALGAAGAAVITIVQPQVPSAEASGDRMLVTASSEGTNCVEDKSLLVVDFDYAAKLVKGIASGEIIIALGPVPVAALEEGDKTAVVEPITISPEEVWQNLVKVVPECPPVVVEPTPFIQKSSEETILDPEHEDITIKQLKSHTLQLYNRVSPEVDKNDGWSWSLKELKKRLTYAERGDPAINKLYSGKTDLLRDLRMGNVSDITVWAYKEYIKTKDERFLTIARESHWYGETEFGNAYSKNYDPIIERLTDHHSDF